MRSKILTTSAVALLLFSVAASQAYASADQWGSRAPYGYEGRRTYERYAFDSGWRDGYNRGIDDLRHHRVPEVWRQKWYRNGDHHYNRDYGSREEYRIEYRRGFREGYDRAYREARWRY